MEIIATFPGRGKTASMIIKNIDRTQATTITATPVAQTCNEKTSMEIIKTTMKAYSNIIEAMVNNPSKP